MAHAEGWIEAYEALEEGRALESGLLSTVLGNRNRLGESMLHWYAIEGKPTVVEKIIGLGFDVNTTNTFGRTPLFDCVTIDRWEIVALLVAHGAKTDFRDVNGESIFDYLDENDEHENLKKLEKLIGFGKQPRPRP